ncbi:MAG: type IV toxin-antitoxin system AbiEi family antitoxin domain-containing protein [Verrucomicrobiota bacterium]
MIGHHLAYNHAMPRSSKASVDRLYACASKQQGFFTTKQAIAAGYPDTVHAYHLRNGDWTRSRRGIYRLNRYPPTDQAAWVIWSLWSRGRSDQPMGVYSHRTALEIHGLLPPSNDQLHMTVPGRFRRMNPLPDHIVFYRQPLRPADVEPREGYSTTTLARTVLDLDRLQQLEAILPPDQVYQLRIRDDVRDLIRQEREASDRDEDDEDESWAAWA